MILLLWINWGSIKAKFDTLGLPGQQNPARRSGTEA